MVPWLSPLLSSREFILGVAFGSLSVVTASLARRNRVVDLALPLVVLIAAVTPWLAVFGATVPAFAVRPSPRLRRLAAMAGAIIVAAALRARGLQLLPVLAAAVVLMCGEGHRERSALRTLLQWTVAMLVAGAIYANVPDTEQARALVGFCGSGLCCSALLGGGTRLGHSFPLLAAIVVIVGGSTRSSALIGGAASVAILGTSARTWQLALAAVAFGCLVTARLSGLAATPERAVAWALLGLAPAVAVSVADLRPAARPWSRRQGDG